MNDLEYSDFFFNSGTLPVMLPVLQGPKPQMKLLFSGTILPSSTVRAGLQPASDPHNAITHPARYDLLSFCISIIATNLGSNGEMSLRPGAFATEHCNRQAAECMINECTAILLQHGSMKRTWNLEHLRLQASLRQTSCGCMRAM